jgi:hypothetical protein
MITIIIIVVKHSFNSYTNFLLSKAGGRKNSLPLYEQAVTAFVSVII